MTPLQKAAQAVINQCEVEALWASYPWLGAKLAELRKAFDAELQQSVEPEVLMVDAAMVEMKNIVPPLRRSECLRLIRAAINATAHPPQPQATTPAVPEGYVLVPIEATPAMDNAYRKSPCRDLSGLWHEIITAAAQGANR